MTAARDDELRIDGFEVLDRIGQGASATVYRARQVVLDRIVAVKVFNASGGDVAMRTRFARECAIAARVSDHPSIVTIHTTGWTADGRPYLVMEHMDGGSLEHRCRRGPLPAVDALRLGIAVAGALETAHLHGLLHRDVKPANVLFDRSGNARLADFGIATVAGSAGGAGRAGTATFAAPEVEVGEPASVRSDIYSFGATLRAATTAEPEPADDGGDAVARDLSRLLDGLMAADPADRPESMASVAAALSELGQLHHLQLPPAVVEHPRVGDLEPLTSDAASATSLPAEPPRRGASRRWVIAAAGLVVVAAIVSTALLLNRSGPATVTASGSGPTTTARTPSTTAANQAWAPTPDPNGQDGYVSLAAAPDLAPSSNLALEARMFDFAGRAALPAGTPQGVPHDIAAWSQPGRVVINFWNELGTKECRGWKSTELGIRGAQLLDQYVYGAIAHVELYQLATDAQATETFEGFSLQFGARPASCAGFDASGVPIRRDDIRVTRNDLDAPTPTGVDQLNVWFEPQAKPDEAALSAVVRVGPLVARLRYTFSPSTPPSAPQLIAIVDDLATSLTRH